MKSLKSQGDYAVFGSKASKVPGLKNPLLEMRPSSNPPKI